MTKEKSEQKHIRYMKQKNYTKMYSHKNKNKYNYSFKSRNISFVLINNNFKNFIIFKYFHLGHFNVICDYFFLL